jgi:hypothetical protein
MPGPVDELHCSHHCSLADWSELSLRQAEWFQGRGQHEAGVAYSRVPVERSADRAAELRGRY